MHHTVLVVEDDPSTRHVLAGSLESAGIDSLLAENGASMWRLLAENPDLIILDLSLPDADGLEILRRLRQQSDIPVLIHSTRSDEIERIIGIEIGADDFLPKPCNLRELIARVKALLRRAGSRKGTGPRAGGVLKFGNWSLDTACRRLTDGEGQEVAIGVSAYALLMAFLEKPFQPLSREHLSRALKREYVAYDRIIDVHVSQIRRLLGNQADGSSFIKTVRSQGYVFTADVVCGQETQAPAGH
jgi:two-component system OmpR family response regulator